MPSREGEKRRCHNTDHARPPQSKAISGCRIQSGRGQPHSRTLARTPTTRLCPQGPGVRLSSAALDSRFRDPCSSSCLLGYVVAGSRPRCGHSSCASAVVLIERSRNTIRKMIAMPATSARIPATATLVFMLGDTGISGSWALSRPRTLDTLVLRLPVICIEVGWVEPL